MVMLYWFSQQKKQKGEIRIKSKSLFVWDASVWSAAASGGADMVALMLIQEIPKQKCNIKETNRNAT